MHPNLSSWRRGSYVQKGWCLDIFLAKPLGVRQFKAPTSDVNEFARYGRMWTSPQFPEVRNVFSTFVHYLSKGLGSTKMLVSKVLQHCFLSVSLKFDTRVDLDYPADHPKIYNIYVNYIFNEIVLFGYHRGYHIYENIMGLLWGCYGI
jgi:hypothetical protein